MKTAITLKEFSDLSSGAVQVTHATALAIPQSSPQHDDPTGEDFREMQHRRYTAPFPCPSPYQHWGINE